MQSKLNRLSTILTDIESDRLRLSELLGIRLKLKEDLKTIKEARTKKTIPSDLHLDYFKK